eukprot:PhM_4_TR18208/c0_g1_i1/m.71646
MQRTLLEFLESRVATQPESTAFSVHDGETEESISYAALHASAKTNAYQLLQLSNASFGGQASVLLLLPSGVQAITSTFGAMYAGMVPVLMCPPDDMSWLDTALPQLLQVIETSGTTMAVTTKLIYKIVARFLADLPQVKQLKWHIIDRT